MKSLHLGQLFAVVGFFLRIEGAPSSIENKETFRGQFQTWLVSQPRRVSRPFSKTMCLPPRPPHLPANSSARATVQTPPRLPAQFAARAIREKPLRSPTNFSARATRGAAKILREYNFNPDELRDWRGQWTTGGSDSSPFKVCFAEGTPVLMADGAWKHIEEIQPGEIVLSVSEGNPEDKVDSKAVVQVYHNKPQPLVELYLDGGVIRTTANHPFHVRNRGWIPASQLQIANQFRGHDDQWVEFRRKMISDAIKPVFNLQVADHHTYFVGAPERTDIGAGA